VDNADTPPDWTQTFRCKLIKPDTKLELREVIAGKTQRQQETVAGMRFSDRVKWLRREMELQIKELEDAGAPVTLNRTALLRTTYVKTGCTAAEGSMVCLAG
jgi:hypothetical protein